MNRHPLDYPTGKPQSLYCLFYSIGTNLRATPQQQQQQKEEEKTIIKNELSNDN